MIPDAYPYGGELTRNDLVSVGNASVMISPAHPRQEIIIQNTTNAALMVTVSVGKSAVPLIGIPLAPYAVYYGSNNSEFRTTSEAIYAICHDAAGTAQAGGQVSIFER